MLRKYPLFGMALSALLWYAAPARADDYFAGAQPAEASPSDAAVPEPAMPEVAYDAALPTTCDTCCAPACDEEPVRLFEPHCNGLSLTGWIDAGYGANAWNPASKFNGPVTFADRDNEFQMNQAYLVLEKGIDTGGCGWDFGGRVDVLYGTDARFTKSLGLELRRDGSDHWNSHRFYQLALPQFYGEVGYNDLSVKVGHFYTIIGYESVMAPQNFFYTHAYTMQYGEPFTHTGGLATYQYSDTLQLLGGITNGWDAFDSVYTSVSFLGGAIWTSCDEATSVAFTFSTGNDDNGAGNDTDDVRTVYSLVVQQKLNDCWSYVFQHDNGWQQNFQGSGQDAQWYGVNQYLFYKYNDCWKFGVRGEWFRDDDGARLVSQPVGDPNVAAFYQANGVNSNVVAGNYYEVSLGANYTPNANVVIRPEVRWDWSDGTLAAPYNDYSRDSQFMGAVDVIVAF